MSSSRSGARRNTAPSAGARLLMGIHRHRTTAVEALQRLLQAPVATLMTVAVLGIALLLPALLSVVLSSLSSLGEGMDEAGRLSLYLQRGVDAERASELRDSLAERPDIERVDFISPEDALAEFQEYSGFGDIVQELDENPLPTVLLVYPGSLDLGAGERLLEELQILPEVELAQLDLEWVRRLNALMAVGERISAALTLLFSLAVLLIAGNTVRLAIENRRDEIVVVKLVGGTDSFVARPFLYTGLWYGLLGGFLALVLLAALQFWTWGPVSRALQLYDSPYAIEGPGLATVALLLGGGALLGWGGALMSVKQHLSSIEPQ